MIKLTVFETIKHRCVEEAANDYLSIAAQFLLQGWCSEDRLFHCCRDVLMAVMRRKLLLGSVRMEILRLTAASHDHVLDVNGRRVIMATPIPFDLTPVSQFSTFNY
jgi:hypothetical protein